MPPRYAAFPKMFAGEAYEGFGETSLISARATCNRIRSCSASVISLNALLGEPAACIEASVNFSGPVFGSGYLNFDSAKRQGLRIIGMIFTLFSFAFRRRTGSSLLRTYLEARNAGLTKSTAARAPLSCFWMCACQSSPRPMSSSEQMVSSSCCPVREILEAIQPALTRVGAFVVLIRIADEDGFGFCHSKFLWCFVWRGMCDLILATKDQGLCRTSWDAWFCQAQSDEENATGLIRHRQQMSVLRV